MAMVEGVLGEALVSVGYWVGDDGQHRGAVREFNIWATASTLYLLLNKLADRASDRKAVRQSLREKKVGDKATFFYDPDTREWTKVLCIFVVRLPIPRVFLSTGR